MQTIIISKYDSLWRPTFLSVNVAVILLKMQSQFLMRIVFLCWLRFSNLKWMRKNRNYRNGFNLKESKNYVASEIDIHSKHSEQKVKKKKKQQENKRTNERTNERKEKLSFFSNQSDSSHSKIIMKVKTRSFWDSMDSFLFHLHRNQFQWAHSKPAHVMILLIELMECHDKITTQFFNKSKLINSEWVISTIYTWRMLLSWPLNHRPMTVYSLVISCQSDVSVICSTFSWMHCTFTPNQLILDMF